MPGSELSEDRQWLRAFRDGDAAALERAFRTYAPRVHMMLTRGIGQGGSRVSVTNASDVEDLVHEVFLRAFQERARLQYDGIRPYSAWLRTVAHNVLVDHLRKNATQQRITAEDATAMMEDVASQEPLPDDNLLTRQQQEAVEQFLDQLSPSERALVEVRFTKGMSQRDAAKELGVTRPRVRWLEERIRSRLREFQPLRNLLK